MSLGSLALFQAHNMREAYSVAKHAPLLFELFSISCVARLWYRYLTMPRFEQLGDVLVSCMDVSCKAAS